MFSESVWINVGDNFENMRVEIYDLRGRLAYKEEGLESGTFKMYLHNLRPSLYFFAIIRDNEVVTVLRSVKI